MQENVSYELRQKRSRKMKAMAQRLKQARKNAANKHASPEKLKKRAAKLARELIRKKIAGLHGQHYADLSSAAKIAMDKLMDPRSKSEAQSVS